MTENLPAGNLVASASPSPGLADIVGEGAWSLRVLEIREGMTTQVSHTAHDWPTGLPPASAGHRLIEAGFMIVDRSVGHAGWFKIADADSTNASEVWQAKVRRIRQA